MFVYIHCRADEKKFSARMMCAVLPVSESGFYKRKRYEAAWEYESDRLSMISESERKGLAEGSRQTKLETAKSMLTMGYPLGDICKIVGLPQAEVEALK